MFLDAERERFAAEITQAQAELEASLSFLTPLMVDGVIPPGTSYPTEHAPTTHLSRFKQ